MSITLSPRYVDFSSKRVRRIAGLAGLASIAFAMLSVTAYAGGANTTAGTTEFGGIETQLLGWLNGDLGRIMVIAGGLVGAGIGIVRQNIMFAVSAAGLAMVLANLEAIVDNIFGAGIPLAAAAAPVLPVFGG